MTKQQAIKLAKTVFPHLTVETASSFAAVKGIVMVASEHCVTIVHRERDQSRLQSVCMATQELEHERRR